MALAWAKRYLPRTLYGRAALILLVPVLVLQLVVSVVFIQRHYEGVTEQMTRNIVQELQLLLTLVSEAESAEGALDRAAPFAVPLAFELQLPAVPPETDLRHDYDLSALAMMRTMRALMPEVQRFDVTQRRQVWVWFDTPHGVMSAMFDRRRVSASNPHQLLVLMIFAGIILTGISIVFMRSQLRPIRRLARASEAFGRGQVLPYQPRGATEIRAAGRAFVAMRMRIERHIEQRTMMLSGVSHDLRTPLTRLKLGLSLLEDSKDVRDMLRDVGDMERLLEEFLAFARGATLEDVQEVDPAALVRGVVDKYREAPVPVGFDDPGGLEKMTLHPMSVARALENLVGNAVKHGTEVAVSLAPGAQVLRIAVEDNGPGIPAHARGEALKPFSQLDEARNQNKGSGVGLGLAIADDIARRHGGALELGTSPRLGGLRAVISLAR